MSKIEEIKLDYTSRADMSADVRDLLEVKAKLNEIISVLNEVISRSHFKEEQ